MAGFPTWTPSSRIVPFSYTRRNEFAIRADPSEISGVPSPEKRSSRNVALSRMGADLHFPRAPFPGIWTRTRQSAWG